MIPRVEVPDHVIAEAEEVNRAVEELLASAPRTETVPPEESRRARAEGRGWAGPVVRLDEAADRTIAGPAGELTLRTFTPDTVRGVFLHLHGGGWVLGAADQQDALLSTIATTAEVAVVSLEYRLAPEHPFPAAPDDCAAAAGWLLEHAVREWGTDRLLIGGESAGAHLAATTLLRLRDAGAVDRFVAANLVFGAYDLSMTPSQRNWGTRNLVLSTPLMEWFYDHFLPGTSPEERRDPGLSPLYADLTGLPPALFTVGDLDPLLDDSLFMAARWAAAGNDAELAVYPAGIHGFHAFPTELGRRCLDQQLQFLRRHAAGA